MLSLNFRKQLVERMKLPKSNMLHPQCYTCSNVQFLFGFIFSLKLDFSIPLFQNKYWYMRKYEIFCGSTLCSDFHTFTSSLMYSTSICSYTMCNILTQVHALYSDCQEFLTWASVAKEIVQTFPIFLAFNT